MISRLDLCAWSKAPDVVQDIVHEFTYYMSPTEQKILNRAKILILYLAATQSMFRPGY